VLRTAFVHGCRSGAFRICQFSIQGNHIHLICEAGDQTQLARGIQGWSVRVARGLNGHLGRTGAVFDDRYHLEILTTPTQTRHALCYVLQNARRHGEPIDPRYGGMDPFSSAWWFDGWADASWKVGIPPPEVRTVAEAETWLLRGGWKRAPSGLLSITEVPPAVGGDPAGWNALDPGGRIRLAHSLATVADIGPEQSEDLRRDIDPEWVMQALEATGTATVRSRALPAEQVMWLMALRSHLLAAVAFGPDATGESRTRRTCGRRCRAIRSRSSSADSPPRRAQIK
jgi:hypothetical protein